MKQTTKTLATVGILAAVALAVAFAAAWAGRDEEKKTEAKEKSEKLFDFDKANVRQLKLVKGGKLVAELKRDDDKSAWKITAPVQADADETPLNGILDKLTTLKQKSEVEGMDPKLAAVADEATARLAVQVTDATGKATGLLIGEDNPFDQSLYVKKTGETLVRMVAKADKAPFEKDLFALRDKRVAHIEETAGLTHLAVTPDASAKGGTEGGAFAYEIDRDGGNWKLSKPAPGRADSTSIDRLVQEIKGLRAKSVVSESGDAAALAQYGLVLPKLTVAMTVAPLGGKDSFSRKLLIGQPPLSGGAVTIKTYAKREDAPAIYEVDNQIVKALSRDLFDLEDKTLLQVQREAVRRIELAAPGQPALEIARTKEMLADGGTGEEKLTVTAPRQGPAKRFKLSGDLSALQNLKAVAFGEPKPSDPKSLAKLGLDHPRTVTLFGDKDAVLGKLLIGSLTGEKDKPRYWVWAEGTPRVAQLDKTIVDDLPFTAQDALEPAPAAPAADAGIPAPSGAK